jgi:hypothetical protein
VGLIDASLRWELMQELNRVKGLIRQAIRAGEISRSLGNSALMRVGQVKQVLYSDLDFKETWMRQSERPPVRVYG